MKKNPLNNYQPKLTLKIPKKYFIYYKKKNFRQNIFN